MARIPLTRPHRLEIVQAFAGHERFSLTFSEQAVDIAHQGGQQQDTQHFHFPLTGLASCDPECQELVQFIRQQMQAMLLNHRPEVHRDENHQAIMQAILDLNHLEPKLAADSLHCYIGLLSQIIPALEAPFLQLKPQTLVLSDHHWH